MGKSSPANRKLSEACLHAPILQLDSLRQSDDVELMRQITRAGNGKVIDEARLDWWVLISVFIYAPLEQAVLLTRLASKTGGVVDLYSTRPGWPASGLALLLGQPLQTFPESRLPSRFGHYRGILKRFSSDQIAQIFLDKYDPRYKLRRRFSRLKHAGRGPVVLLPSAYTNVSQMAVAYAQMLPEQSFLLVATRRSGTHFAPASNVECASLAAYADGSDSPDEYRRILDQWSTLKKSLELLPEMSLLSRAGLLDSFALHLRDGLAVRNAWRAVLDQENVAAVMCGDDSNPSTRLPVMLAREQDIPTLDFHHGSMDGRFILKPLSSDLYLAKGEMERDFLLRVCGLPAERVVLGGPKRSASTSNGRSAEKETSNIIFFSESYESGGWRAAEVYQELLPPLVRLAMESKRKLIVKLHPFESRHERTQILEKILSSSEAAMVELVEGPFTAQLVEQTWFGITVESTTVVDCALLGVPCFVCDWLSSSPRAYTRQFARFGAGRILHSPDELEKLPEILAEPAARLSENALLTPIEPDWLRQIISRGMRTRVLQIPEQKII